MDAFENSFESWWFGSETYPVPGRVVPFFGAGISIDSPSDLPSGIVLTRALLDHLLDEHATSELLGAYERCAETLLRSVPRLEHVLSAALRSTDGRAGQLLRIFEDVIPNKLHHTLARRLTASRGWAITTNFDEAVELASGYRIPVHIVDLNSNSIKVLHGSDDADWGLIKLHGTIGQGIDGLGTTLEVITRGLHPSMRKLLDHVLGTADAVVVAGYSASDHFDIGAYLRPKLNERLPARLIWVQHAAIDVEIEGDPWPESSGFNAFQYAFSGTKRRTGNTANLLAEMLGEKNIDQDMEISAEQNLDLKNRLQELYEPTRVERHMIGAVLLTAVGLATCAREEIARARHYDDDDSHALAFEHDVFRCEGNFDCAMQAARRATRKAGVDTRVAQLRILREQGKPIKAIIHGCLLFVNANIRPLSRDDRPWLPVEIAAAALDLIGRSQGLPFLQSRIPRRVFGWSIRRLIAHAENSAEILTPLLDAMLERLRLRRFSLCEDINSQTGSWAWRTIEEGVSWPDFYTENGPLIPGYHLVAQNTYIELDLLVDFISGILDHVKVLEDICRRRHFNRLYMLRWLTQWLLLSKSEIGRAHV